MKLVLGIVLVWMISLVFIIKLMRGRGDDEEQKKEQTEEEDSE